MTLRLKRPLFAFGLLVAVSIGSVVSVAVATSPTAAAPQAKKTPEAEKSTPEEETDAKPVLADFMRMKMDASHDIMEGLLLEDSKLINKAAKKLKEMSDTEHWRVSNDILYRNHSEDFRSSVDKLITASKGRSIDRAALSWFDVTLSCIDCHRYVRTVLIADVK